MKEEFVSYEIAKRLKECGFDWKCDHYYCAFDNETDVRFWSIHPAQSSNGFSDCEDKVIADAPTQALAQKWLREVKGWNIQVRINGVRSAYWYEIWSTTPNGPVYGTPDDETFRRGQYDNYEEALSQGISKVLTLLTEKQCP